jgi:hypothetical protein
MFSAFQQYMGVGGSENTFIAKISEIRMKKFFLTMLAL